MEIILTKSQVDSLIPQEHEDFVIAWKNKNNSYPRFRQLQQSGQRVSDTLPTHPKSNMTTKEYVDKHLGKFLKLIVAKLANQYGETLEKKRGTKSFVSKDAKQLLRSELEVLTYNIFVLEGVENEIEVDSKRFKDSCGGKEPDFVWENRKIIIEVAGMESDEYKNKLQDAEKCFENLGYTVYVIDARKFEKQGKYVSYYKYLCDLLGFEPKQEVINEPYKYLGYTELSREEKQKYIDDNINAFPVTPTQRYKLNKYINQLYGIGKKEYKRRLGMKRYSSSVDKEEIKKFKSQNPMMSNQEIANHFGISKNTVQQATTGMEGRKR